MTAWKPSHREEVISVLWWILACLLHLAGCAWWVVSLAAGKGLFDGIEAVICVFRGWREEAKSEHKNETTMSKPIIEFVGLNKLDKEDLIELVKAQFSQQKATILVLEQLVKKARPGESDQERADRYKGAMDNMDEASDSFEKLILRLLAKNKGAEDVG